MPAMVVRIHLPQLIGGNGFFISDIWTFAFTQHIVAAYLLLNYECTTICRTCEDPEQTR